MGTLDGLFPDGPRERGDGREVTEDHHTVRRLEAMIGPARTSSRARHDVADVAELRETVATARASAMTDRGKPMEKKGTVRKRRRRVDYLGLSVAAIAVVTVVSAGALGVVQLATASPASASLRLLDEDEALLIDLEESLKAEVAAIEADRTAQLEEAAALRATLESVREAPNPASSDDGMMPVVDAASLDAAVADVDAHVAALGEVVVPTLPAPYVRGDVDEDSLADVGDAMNVVQEQRDALDDVAVEVKAARETVEAAPSALAAKLAAFTQSIPAQAAVLVEENSDAEQELREGVDAAAAAVAAADLTTAEGLRALTGYRDAVVALVEDEVRADIEAEQARETERSQNSNRGDGDSNNDGEESTDPSEPTDPGTDPAPPVEQPEVPPTENDSSEG